MPILQINDRVMVSSAHWKCARETGVIIEVDGSRVNKYRIQFDRGVPGTLGNRELWLGDPDLTVLAHQSPRTTRPTAFRIVPAKSKAHRDKRISLLSHPANTAA